MPAAKQPLEPVLYADAAALAQAATDAGLPALAGSVWSYNVGSVNWLAGTSWADPGWLNKIRRDLRTALEDIDPVFGSRGWPSDCVVSGPWVLPPGAYVLGGIPGTNDGGLGTWAGVQVAAAGSYSVFKELRCIAWEDILAWRFRADVSKVTPYAVDGGGVPQPDYGWSGSFDMGLGGWVGLKFEAAMNPACDIIPYQNGSDAMVFITLPNSGADVTATLNGVSAVVTETPGSGAFTYSVDVRGVTTSLLRVQFTWTPGTYGAALAFGMVFSAQYDWTGRDYDAALAESPCMAFAESEFAVTASGQGWQLGTVYAWPVFADADARGNEQFCIMAKTQPVRRVYHNDKSMTGPRLNPQWDRQASINGLWIDCYPAAAQRSDTAAADRDGLSQSNGKPAWTVPTTPGLYRCESVVGVTVWRRGTTWNHAPLVPDLSADAARPALGHEVEISLGVWRGGSHDASLPRLWTGGELDPVDKVILKATYAYQHFAFDVPWPALELKSLVWEANHDEVELTGLVVAEVSIPLAVAGSVDDWDCAWVGATAGSVDRGGGGSDFPARPDDSGDAWVDYPGPAYSEAAPAAWFNDTLALLALL